MDVKQKEPVSILMVGIGGYGYYYMKTLLEEFEAESYKLAGVVDPFAEHSGYFPEIKKREIPVYSQIEDFYDNGHTAELAVISSPIHYHVPQSCVALKHGTNVLCDKPVAALVQEVDALIRVRDESGKWVMIGYQWSFSKAIQSLKKDIRKGLFGKPIKLKTLCLWPRGDAYYQRNNWAGKLKDKEGRWILDSPVNNAMAHYLHNLFYVLGEEINISASPKKVKAEIYRANPIENYDTAVCRIYTTEGIELLFYASHVSLATKDAIFNFEFEDAIVSFGEFSKGIIVVDKKCNEKSYGAPDDDHHFLKLFEAIKTVRQAKPIVCGPEAARSQTLCMNGIQESVPQIPTFPHSMIQRDDKEARYWVQGLDIALYNCYNNDILPHESDFTWAKKGEFIDLTNYSKFSEYMF